MRRHRKKRRRKQDRTLQSKINSFYDLATRMNFHDITKDEIQKLLISPLYKKANKLVIMDAIESMNETYIGDISE